MRILLIVWAGVTAVAGCLLLYRAMLTRYEEDQLFLDDAILSEERERQNKLQQRLTQIQPYLRVAGGAAALMFVALIGSLTWQAYQALR
ncbi:hypothetical protein [Terriglobus saanensis]|uniref:Uncharacterized protein n=1 Tax=Terriglobus saanensis (strain ATCC BAA-1853 / DSM 23119 / SP1PR4) TaxID=401053 RepID=E8V5Y3_TERSS|nr:hypothetical protein [Terriglobus saanensis]ADV83801.1 hypothetical protein AciPR4_3042 [Terriglobus saanensis SP1PR4]